MRAPAVPFGRYRLVWCEGEFTFSRVDPALAEAAALALPSGVELAAYPEVFR